MVREFLDGEIDFEAIKKILEAGNQAPTWNLYQTTLNMVMNETDQFLICQKNERTKEYFTLQDFKSFRSIGAPALRAAVGRGIAKYFKEHKEIEYLRGENGNICRTKNNHAAIYRILHE